ncbi:cytosolic arginine sensor for mTORC1 subunit 2-like isoform X2 [Watersipora subatra]|uniref:cytosolic arginine sensor for mTORC1 subunit 2-like isoform X2 n=1 Tax=Watersipora subatra TaxID=2589382 RepID=UPI00355C92AB
MDERMEINILDYKLKLTSIKKGQNVISKYTHALLDILFLRNARLQTQYSFVNVTETDQDYSVVCEESCLPLLKGCGEELIVVDGIWVPLVVSVGLEGISTAGISKIAHSVIIPLADFQISVYCLSTYKTDYVLVKESDLPAACRVLAHDFKITEENSTESSEIKIDRSEIPVRKDAAVPRLITHRYTSPENTFYVTSMDRCSVETQALALIDCLFYSDSYPHGAGEEPFLSLSMVDQDISLVLDEKLLSRFPPNVLFNTKECWKMVKIGDMPEGLGFDECGIVAQISEPLVDHDISEYYMSTYYNDHSLVPLDQIENVMSILEQRKNSAMAEVAPVESLHPV